MRRSLLLLLAGCALLLVSNGRYSTGVGAWLAPLFLLIYLDRNRLARGLFLLLPLYVGCNFLMWRGIIPAPGWLYYAIATTYSLAYFAPYALHRLTDAGNSVRWHCGLLFPCVYVSVEWLLKLATPYGSWVSIAYTQDPGNPVPQVAAIFGTAGVTFLIAWTGSMLARVAAHGTACCVTRRAFFLWLTVMAICLTFGQWRLSQKHAITRTPRMAALTPKADLRRNFENAFSTGLQREVRTGDGLSEIRSSAAAMNEDLLASTEKEAKAGAEIISWSETAAKILVEQEPEFLATASDIAKRYHLFLVLGLGVWNPAARPAFENKLVAIEPTGQVSWTYQKSRPIVGAEDVKRGDGKLPVWNTMFGRISAAICHDMDFPDLIRQAGAAQVDLLIAPSDDWRTIDRLHAVMARYRALENGFSLVRPANGIAFACDPEGRVLASTNTFEATDASLVLHLPLRRRWTLFPFFGEGLSVMCVAGLVALLVLRLRQRGVINYETDSILPSARP